MNSVKYKYYDADGHGIHRFKASEFKKFIGIKINTLHYYVDTGVVVPLDPGEGQGTARYYDLKNLVEISVIKHLMDLGLKRGELKQIFSNIRKNGDDKGFNQPMHFPPNPDIDVDEVLSGKPDAVAAYNEDVNNRLSRDEGFNQLRFLLLAKGDDGEFVHTFVDSRGGLTDNQDVNLSGNYAAHIAVNISLIMRRCLNFSKVLRGC